MKKAPSNKAKRCDSMGLKPTIKYAFPGIEQQEKVVKFSSQSRNRRTPVVIVKNTIVYVTVNGPMLQVTNNEQVKLSMGNQNE